MEPDELTTRGAEGRFAQRLLHGPLNKVTLGGGRYAMRRRLGEGAMGEVYAAFDREMRCEVALKLLLHIDPGGIQRFKKEFRSLADTVHPNLVVFHELVSDDEFWFLSMELVEGVSFLEYVSPGAVGGVESGGTYRRFDERRLAQALSQLVDGLDFLHGRGIVHRDIKPANVLVAPDGRVVILDFGMARETVPPNLSIDVTLEDRLPAGTPAYMAPGQAACQRPTHEDDWYAVGAMLYEVLTGTLPFRGKVAEVLRRKQVEDPVPPSGRVEGVPAGLDKLCIALLSREPSQRPNAERIRSALQSEPPGQPSRSSGRERAHATDTDDARPFVGRSREMAELLQAFEDSKQDWITVCVSGESGVGKTELVRRFVGELQDVGSARILAGRCYERESVPYKAFDSVLDALGRQLGQWDDADVTRLIPRDIHALTRMFPSLMQVEAIASARGRPADRVEAHELRRRASAALRALLETLADETPLVIFVDDIQWGDAESAELLLELARPPDAPTMLFVATHRDGHIEDSPMLHLLSAGDRAMQHEAKVRRVPLLALDHDDARELASAVLGRDAMPGRADSVARESRGNPFFVWELSGHTRGLGDSTTLADAIGRRVDALPSEACRLLQAVALAGSSIAQACATRAADVSGSGALTRLRDERLVRTHGPRPRDAIEPYHDRIRDAVVDMLSAAAATEIHRRLAQELEADSDSDPELIGTHHERGGHIERAGHFFAVAAERAGASLAFGRASRLYRRALTLDPGDATNRRATQIKLARALTNAGRGAEAADAYRDASRHAPPGEALELQRLAGERLLLCGRIDEGLDATKTVLAQLGVVLPRTTPGAVMSLLGRRARIRLGGLRFKETKPSEIAAEELLRIDTCGSIVAGLTWVDALRGSDLGALHLLLALRAGEPKRVARALTHEIVYRGMAGAEHNTRALLRRTRELVERTDDPHPIAMLTVNHGAVRYLAGQFREGADLCKRAEEILRQRCIGAVWELHSAQLFWMLCLYFMGRIAELMKGLDGLLREAIEQDDRFAETVLRTRFAHMAWLTRDDPTSALEEVLDAIGRWSHRGFHTEHGFALIGEVESLLYAGDGPAALRAISGQWPALSGSGVLRVMQLARIETFHLRARASLAAAGHARGRKPRNRLLRSSERDADRIASEKAEWGNALAALIRAGAAASRGDVTRACAHAKAAELGFERTDMALYRAAARRGRGELLAGTAGLEFITDAEAFAREQGILNPSRMFAMLAPGLPSGR